MQWFKNLDAKPRLLLAFGIVALLVLGLSGLAVRDLGVANQRMTTMYNQELLGVIAVDGIVIARLDAGRSLRDTLLNFDDAQIVTANEKVILDDFARMHVLLEDASKRFYSNEGKATVAAMAEALPAYETTYHDALRSIDAHDLAGSRTALAVTNAVGNRLWQSASKAQDIKRSLAQSAFETNQAAYQIARTVMVTMAVLVVGLAIALAFAIAQSFAAPLAQAVVSLEKLAEGDLTASLDIHTTDEVGRLAVSLNQAIAGLRETMLSVATNAESVNSSSQELAAAADAIASGAQEQAASLEETSASLEQITATVRQSADNARQASQVASASRDSADRGQQDVSDAVGAMAEINTASSRIADIISTINEIAFQTNLLAVNAAVEAARAGEEGRGFAVVATEVRSLAQRSAEAAREIKSLIEDSLSKVKKGTELVNKSGETLRNMVGSVKGVTDIVNEIAAAAAEQSTGVEQVSTAMTQMDHVTQSNAAQTEQLSSTAQALSEQSLQLKELVATFKLGGDSVFSSGLRQTVPATGNPVPPRTKRALQPAAAAPRERAQPHTSAKHQPELALATTADEAAFEEF